MDGSLSATVRAFRITDKPGKVETPAYAVDRVPRREARLDPRTGLPGGRTPASCVQVVEPAIRLRGLKFAAAESLLGLMSATPPAVPLGRIHMRPFKLEVIRQVRAVRNGNSWIPVIGQSAKAM